MISLASTEGLRVEVQWEGGRVGGEGEGRVARVGEWEGVSTKGKEGRKDDVASCSCERCVSFPPEKGDVMYVMRVVRVMCVMYVCEVT